MNYFLVFLGGGIGSVIRYLFSLIFQKTNVALPIATLLANVTSCLLFAGIIYVFKEKHLVPDTYKYIVLVGICGGLSTFSTFSFETFELLKQGLTIWAIGNIIISVLLCVGLFYFLNRSIS